VAKLKKRPLILEFNGSEVWVDKHWSPQKRISLTWLIAWFERYNLQYATRVVVVSAVLKDMLVQQGVDATKILINPNGVDTDLFDPQRYSKHRETVRTAYGMQERFVFGFIGSFSYWHGVELLGALMPRVLAQKPHAHFFLMGTGPLLVQLKAEVHKQGIQDHVTFVGAVPYAQAPSYLAACDTYLCPSQPNKDGTPFFGSPTKLFEYMSMGKPIIASDVDQLRDIINPHIGFLIPPDDVDGFVSAACTLMERDQQEQQNMGNRARGTAVQRHSWQHHVCTIERCLP
jgi:glycosyltransferase involved in cell wall biosynthesis